MKFIIAAISGAITASRHGLVEAVIIFAVVYLVLAFVTGCAAQEKDAAEPEPLVLDNPDSREDGSVTVIMGTEDDACYRGTVKIYEDGKRGIPVYIVIYADKKELLNEQF